MPATFPRAELDPAADYLGQVVDQMITDKGRAICFLASHGSMGNFIDVLRLVVAEGGVFITASQLYSFLKGNLDLPPLSVLMRGDDGAVGFYGSEYQALQQVPGAKLTLYYSLWHRIAYPGQYLTDAQLVEMAASGLVEVQFHAGPLGHDIAMPTNGSGGTGYFYSNRKWLSGPARVETDAEFTERVSADMQAWLDWYVQTLGVHAAPSLHFAAPNGEMGADGAGQTRPLLIAALEAKGFRTSTWRNHMQWMEPGFRAANGGVSTGQAKAYHDVVGLGTEGVPLTTVRSYLDIVRQAHLPSTFFASRFDRSVGQNADWYVAGGSGDTFALTGPVYLVGQPASLTQVYGANPSAAFSYWTRTLPNLPKDVHLQVVFGVPSGFSLPAIRSIAIASMVGGPAPAVSIVADAAGALTATVSAVGAATQVAGVLAVPASGVNWYAVEFRCLSDATRGVLEAWFNHAQVASQEAAAMSGQDYTGEVRVGRMSSSGLATLSGSLHFARYVVDSRFIGTRGLVRA